MAEQEQRTRQQARNPAMSASSQVYFFGTCLIDALYPQAGLDAIALLELCDLKVVYPQAQTCCGQAPYNAGFSDHAAAAAAQTVTLFSEHDWPLVVPSASCAGMIKHHYPRLLASDPSLHQQATQLSGRCVELIDFIAERLPYERLSTNPASNTCVSLHTSCAALREEPVADSWSTVLSRLPGVTLKHPQNKQECCGFGGTFAVKSPALSHALTKDKSAALLADHPDHITSGDCGCLMNIGSHIKYKTGHNPCLHLASIVARAFGIRHEG